MNSNSINNSYQRLDDYFQEDSLISINSFLKVVFIAGCVMLAIAGLVLAGQFFPPLAEFSHALSFIATPLWSTIAVGGGFVIVSVAGLCLYIRQAQANERLRLYLLHASQNGKA